MKRYFVCIVILLLTSCGSDYKLKVKVSTELNGELVGSNDFEFDIDASTKDEAIKKAESKCRTLEMMSEEAIKVRSLASIPFYAALYKEGSFVEEIIWKEPIKENTSVVDSLKIKELSHLFKFENDKFSVDKKIWILPKNAPKYINRNGLFCYFSKTEEDVLDFRLRIQYYADEWLFIRKYNFAIDGTSYEYIPDRVDTDNGEGKIWEWIDVSVTTLDLKEIIKAISTAETAQIKFVGRQYFDVKNITKRERESINNTIQLFEAMGGTFN
ncbi:MAG: hypothetical protein IKY31_02535 [Bacteroidaceae bacterium]|nr:hypothetical protein [Bacteroidaceae bacterium]